MSAVAGVLAGFVVVLVGARLVARWPAARSPAGRPRSRLRTSTFGHWLPVRAVRPPGDAAVAGWCERVAGGVRAGSSLTRSVIDADAATPPTDRPFPGAALALARGQRLADAIGPVADGPGTATGLLAPVLGAAADLGGSAAAPLERVAGTLLARAAEREDRRAASAQARLSAQVLTVLPFGVLATLVLGEPSIRRVLGTPAGLVCLGVGSAANLLGWRWMRHLIDGVVRQ